MTEAFLKMKKFDIAALERPRKGNRKKNRDQELPPNHRVLGGNLFVPPPIGRGVQRRFRDRTSGNRQARAAKFQRRLGHSHRQDHSCGDQAQQDPGRPDSSNVTLKYKPMAEA